MRENAIFALEDVRIRRDGASMSVIDVIRCRALHVAKLANTLFHVCYLLV